MPSTAIERYLSKHAWLDTACELPEPDSRLKLAIVIPSLAERESLPQVLDSLAAGSLRLAEAEVIVLVNNPEGSPREIVENNEATLRDIACRPSGPLRILAVNRASTRAGLPASQAGVGLARRLGMDLALQRLASAGAVERSAIACLDADSPVAPGYVDQVLAAFDRDQPPLGGLCRFAHPQPSDPRLEAAITAYETWLRYVEAGMELAGSLFAFPMIGSCIVVSAEGYALADGMPLRQAAEDFHFLRKLAKVSGWRRLARIAAEVYPEARVSQRVPFGTGRAMLLCLSDGPNLYRNVESPETYLDLKQFFQAAAVPDLRRIRAAAAPLLSEFLHQEDGWAVLEKFVRNYPQPEAFSLAVQHWFDSLRIVRYAHHHARRAGKVWVYDAFVQVLRDLGVSSVLENLPAIRPGEPDPETHFRWLEALRRRGA